MATDKGENLLKPGHTPHENAQFLVFCVAVIRAVTKYSKLLRVTVASAANDHRLGANEAPPAIISIFLGSQLQEVMEQIEQGVAKSAKTSGTMDIGVSVLPKLPMDAGDRNRTSPFAFTGNKFEFRAVGGSQSIAGPNTMLNTIVAESLDFVAGQLETATKGGKDLNAAIKDLLPGIIKDSKKILFMGDNYSAEWHAEAEKRGLPNLKNTVEALPVILEKDSIALFSKYGVYSEGELKSRFVILCENYNKTVNVEGRLTGFMGTTQILPAALRYQGQIAATVNASKTAGADVVAAIGVPEIPDCDHRRLPEGARESGSSARPPCRGRRTGPRQALPRQGTAGHERRAQVRRQTGDDGGRRPLAAADVPRNVVYQVTPSGGAVRFS